MRIWPLAFLLRAQLKPAKATQDDIFCSDNNDDNDDVSSNVGLVGKQLNIQRRPPPCSMVTIVKQQDKDGSPSSTYSILWKVMKLYDEMPRGAFILFVALGF